MEAIGTEFWNEVEKKYPFAYAELDDSYDDTIVFFRDLYTFFDTYLIFVSISYERDIDGNDAFYYEIYKRAKGGAFSDRVEAEEHAFKAAFKLLNNLQG